MVTAIQSNVPRIEPSDSRPAGAGTSAEKAVPPKESTQPTNPIVQSTARAQAKLDTETMRKNLQEAIARINDIVRDGGRGLNFTLDEKLGRPIVMVRNLESGEVIRQIPTEVLVKVAHSIEDLKGLLHNEEA